MTGMVKRIKPGESYGFIVGENEDYFFHQSNFEGDFHELVKRTNRNELIKVSFDTDISTGRGPRACNVVEV